MARLSSQAMATMKTLADSSDSKLAEMVIQGNNMGGHQGAQAPPRLPGQRPQDPCPGREALATEQANVSQMRPSCKGCTRGILPWQPPGPQPRFHLAGALGLAAPFPGIAGRKSLSLLTRPENFFLYWIPECKQQGWEAVRAERGTREETVGASLPPSGVEVVLSCCPNPSRAGRNPPLRETSADGPLGLSELRWYRGSPFALSP